MSKTYLLSTIAVLITAFLPAVQADTSRDELLNQLNQIRLNKLSFARRTPEKFQMDGQAQEKISPFSSNAIATGGFVDIKRQSRQKYFFDAPPLAAHPSSELRPDFGAEYRDNDRPENLVEHPETMIRNLRAMDQTLKQGSVAQPSWSGHFFPTYQGLLGSRIFDSEFLALKEWPLYFDYVRKHPPKKVLKNRDQRDALLSVAEKYDLLVGDTNFSLTRFMWDQGQRYFDKDGQIEKWMGICPGWAAASIMSPRPTVSVSAVAAEGHSSLEFFPSEIKGLISYLWLSKTNQSKIVSGRCNVRNPDLDANGRIIDSDCFDTNPGTWHLVMVNQIGVSRRGFIMDATFDFEVWNQPVRSYSYSYFNPKTMQPSDSLSGAEVRLDEFAEDKYRGYRSPRTQKVVGIAMDVIYTEEELPRPRSPDDPSYDRLARVKYLYDLELDENENVIGGEWYQSKHPDFLWVPREEATPFDVAADTDWNLRERVPARWRDQAIDSSKKGVLWSPIVQRLLTNSSSSN